MQAGPHQPRLRAQRLWPVLLACGLVLASGCSQAPPLKLPDVPLAPAYKEPAPWVPAQPAATWPAPAWWALYGDAELDALEKRLADNSPDLAAAAARYAQARAATAAVNAATWPTLTTSLNTQRDRQSERRPLRVLGPNSPNYYDSTTLTVDFEYELDLWGRVRDQVAAGRALDRAAQADLAAARLALQAQLADQLVLLRGLDRDGALLAEAERAYARAAELINRRHEAGASSGLDLARAQGQLESTRSQRRQSAAQRALVEHAIAALLGDSPSGFALAPKLAEPALPAVPVGVPSTLLQRRADVRAAQERVGAANASVGVARAAFFPQVTLSALGGYQTSDIQHFLGAPNQFWAIGPTLMASLFDGGRRRAEEDRTMAVLDEAGARYRGVVLAAFQQVEDNLALLNEYAAAAQSERAAVAAAQRAVDIATARYAEGAASYLDVVTAQTAALQAQRSASDLATRQGRASVQLVRALGGGWQADAVARGAPEPLPPIGAQPPSL